MKLKVVEKKENNGDKIQYYLDQIKKAPVQKIRLSQIRKNYYFRAGIIRERISAFEDLLLNGGTLPPIILTKNHELIEGAHREAASNNLGNEDIDAKIIDNMPISDMIILSLHLNGGGAIPPTKRDLFHCIESLLELKLSREYIAEHLGVIGPNKVIFGYISEVKTNMKKRRNREIREYLGENPDYERIEAACKKFSVCHEEIKRLLTIAEPKPLIGHVNSGVSRTFQSLSQSMAKTSKSIFEDYLDGKFTTKEVQMFVTHYQSCIKNINNNFSHWSDVFNKAIFTNRMDKEKLMELALMEKGIAV